jgi:PTH1 family peptidyl-tRNA hydrolase
VYLVVGLGNPGPKYAGHRHNVGFMVVERLVARWRAGPLRSKFDGVFARVARPAADVVLLEPHTFMNRSGTAAQKAMAFFRVELTQVVVIHDELDFPLGIVRLKVGGGNAGHNGLKSIGQMCGGPGFVRVRIGIGRPPRDGLPIGHVLSDFAVGERAELEAALGRAEEAVEWVVERGVEAAIAELHRPVTPKAPPEGEPG